MSSDIATAELCRSTKVGLTERKQGGEQISLSALLLLSSCLHPWAEDLNLSAKAQCKKMCVKMRARRKCWEHRKDGGERVEFLFTGSAAVHTGTVEMGG